MHDCSHQALPSRKLAPNQFLNLIPRRIFYFQVEGGRALSYGTLKRRFATIRMFYTMLQTLKLKWVNCCQIT